MKKVFQQSIDQGSGDCTAACIATLTGLAVPNFNLPDASNYSKNIRQWVETSGWAYVERYFHKFESVPLDNVPFEFGWFTFHGAYCLLSVPSQRFSGGWHHVVGRLTSDLLDNGGYRTACTIVHDPNPDNAPYPDDVQVRSVTFLVPNTEILK